MIVLKAADFVSGHTVFQMFATIYMRINGFKRLVDAAVFVREITSISSKDLICFNELSLLNVFYTFSCSVILGRDIICVK